MTSIELPPAALELPPRGIPVKNRIALRWGVVAVPLLVIALTSRVGMIAWPFLNDSGLYAQLGKTVATGGVIYRDFYETKLPGAALLASVFWRAFGPHWTGYVLCQLAMALLAAAALARAAGRHVGRSAALPTFLFAAVYLNLSQAVFTGFQLETLQVFFEAIAAMAALEAIGCDDRCSTFTAGLAAGMAAMAKPGGVGVAAALAMVLMIRGKHRWRHLAALVGGVAIPTAVTILYTVRSGAWSYLPGVIQDIQHYTAGTPMGLDSVVKVLIVFLVLGFPFLFVRKSGSGNGAMPMLLAWFCFDLLAVLMQRRLYPYHFLPLVCPVAMMYGRHFLDSPGRRAWAIKDHAMLLLGLFPIGLLSLTWQGSSIGEISRGFSRSSAGDYLIDHTDPSDCIFADQAGRLLIETDRQPGSRLGTFFYLVNDDDAPRRYMRILLEDFRSRKPKYLVLPTDWDRPVPGLADGDIASRCPRRRQNLIAAWAALRDYVHLHYHLESTCGDVLMYRRVAEVSEQRFGYCKNTFSCARAPSGGAVDRSAQALQAGAGDQSR
jgi:hypothetical protein